MTNKTFDIEKLKKEMGIEPEALQPYNYERYYAINPNLTEDVYKHLRQNRAEWKILCGLGVFSPWGSEMLKEVWWLKGGDKYKETDFYKYRFVPEHYLNLTTW
jgi:hypothetical protein